MKIGLIKMTRNEYREGYYCVRDYNVTFLGLPVFRARFTSTNNQALRQLTVFKDAQLHIEGFNSSQNYETKDFNQKN